MVRAVAAAALTLVACASDRKGTAARPARRESPRELIEGTFEPYRNCRSYSDRGVKVVRFEDERFDAGELPACAPETRSEFATAFDRDTDSFKIEVRQKNCLLPEEHIAIWSSPNGPPRSWSTLHCNVQE